MTVFIDSGALVAALFRSDRHHEAFRELFLRLPKRSFTSMLVLSENPDAIIRAKNLPGVFKGTCVMWPRT